MPAPAVIMPLAEVADRYTIAKLKYERLSGENLDVLLDQVKYYEKGLNFTADGMAELIQQLYLINARMWDAEYAIRLGQDQQLGLEEIGRRALHIRDLNRERMKLKNQICQLTGTGFTEVKMNYAAPVASEAETPGSQATCTA